jgi:hypothetical protein
MDPISLVVLIVVIGIVSILLDRKWQARQAEGGKSISLNIAKEQAASFLSQTSSKAQAMTNQAADRVKSLGNEASKQVKTMASQASDQAQSLRQRIPFARPKPSLAADFRGWVSQATSGEADLRDWLVGLTDSQFADFTDNVAAFCTTTGFDLAWLVREEFRSMPQLAEKGRLVVVNYCRACRQAALAQTGLESFRAYRDYIQNPGSRQGKVYGEKLLDRLLEAGLTTVSLSDFLGAAPKAKQKQVLQAIQSAAEKDPAAFSRVLSSMTSDAAPSTPQGETAPIGAAT